MSRRHFEDNHHAQLYAKFRPTYPQQLFAKLADVTAVGTTLKRAVDVGCGSGQSTFGLASYFADVTGIDPSEAQIAQATTANKHANVRFLVASAEHMPLPDAAVDLVAVAQALHWMDFAPFYQECDRVLRPGGVIAAYGYGMMRFSDPIHGSALNGIVDAFYEQTIDDKFWDDRRQYVDGAYTAAELQIPYADSARDDTMTITRTLSLREVLMYISTWSGYQAKLRAQPETQCLQEICKSMLEVLGETSDTEAKVNIYYPIFLLLGRKPAS